MATFTGGPYRFVRWGLAGALLVLALVAAGCGSGGSLALDPVASAADRTLDKGTGRFDLQMAFTLPLLGRATVSGEGSFDNAKQAMDVTMHVQGVGTGMPGSVELRLLYPAMYAKLEGLPTGGHLPDGKTWVKVDVERALKKLGLNLASLGVGQSPTGVLAQLRGSKNTEKVGTETIDGVRTTHYRGTVDAQEALGQATAKERKALQQLLDEAQAHGVDAASTTFDVWVGDDGLVRRLTQQVGSVGHVTMTFSDYGKPVQIAAPPTDETIDLSDLSPSG
ncbi:MAG TPA: LppX_LprAFG lipoprotein [Gaiellaceae bacterium]